MIFRRGLGGGFRRAVQRCGAFARRRVSNGGIRGGLSGFFRDRSGGRRRQAEGLVPRPQGRGHATEGRHLKAVRVRKADAQDDDDDDDGAHTYANT